MSTRKGLLHVAIAASFACAAVEANAVALDPGGVGQVLLYPYYTVNGGNQTLLSVVNTTNRVKAIKVRFLEARNSKPAFAFNVYLAPFDQWTAAVFAPAATGPARIVTFDASCTVPRLLPGEAQPFTELAYSGANSDHPPAFDAALSAPERTREGHIEIIEMGLLQTGSGVTELAEEATFLASGTPANCGALVAQWLPPSGAWLANAATDVDLPGGGLSGTASIVDASDGAMISYRADALRDFYTTPSAPGALHSEPASASPDLGSARNIHTGGALAVVDLPGLGARVETFASAIDAVSLVLMQSELLNEFNVDAGLGAATEWVVTFPTKRYYTDVASNAQVRLPFTDAFRDDGAGREEIQRDFHDRDGRPRGFVDGPCDPILDPPPVDCGTRFAASVNVLAFATEFTAAQTTEILGATFDANAVRVVTQPGFFGGVPFRSGWASVRFEDATTAAVDHYLFGPSTGILYRGLPAIGFAAIRVVNQAAQPGLIANYAGAYRHRGAMRAVLIEP